MQALCELEYRDDAGCTKQTGFFHSLVELVSVSLSSASSASCAWVTATWSAKQSADTKQRRRMAAILVCSSSAPCQKHRNTLPSAAHFRLPTDLFHLHLLFVPRWLQVDGPRTKREQRWTRGRTKREQGGASDRTDEARAGRWKRQDGRRERAEVKATSVPRGSIFQRARLLRNQCALPSSASTWAALRAPQCSCCCAAGFWQPVAGC